MSTPNHDSVCGPLTDEQAEELRQRLLRYWKVRCPHLAEDLAQEGMLQICEKGVSGWRGKNGAKASTYRQSVGIRKGIDFLRKELRSQRNADLGGEPLVRAEARMLQNPWQCEGALISSFEMLGDDDYEDGDAESKK